MLAIIAAIVLGIALLADLLNTNFGAPDLINWNTLVLIALFCWPSTSAASARARSAAEVGAELVRATTRPGLTAARDLTGRGRGPSAPGPARPRPRSRPPQ